MVSLLDMLSGVIGTETDYALYMVTCRKYRTGVARLLNVLPAILVNPKLTLAGTWYLVACHDRGTLALLGTNLRGVSRSIEVPDWQPSWKDDFHRVVVDGLEFIKAGRFRMRGW